MYGLVVEGVRFMIREKFDEKILTDVLMKCHLSGQTLSTHDRYSEKMVPNMLVALCEVAGITMEEVGVLAGNVVLCKSRVLNDALRSILCAVHGEARLRRADAGHGPAIRRFPQGTRQSP